MHIIFQVLNFIFNFDNKKYQLIPVDKLILLSLAKHHGPKGIFPSQKVISIEVQISSRYVRERIEFMESIGLLCVKKISRKYHYTLLFLQEIPEPQFRYDEINSGTPVPLLMPIFPPIAEPQFQNSGTPVPTINTEDQLNLKSKDKNMVFLPEWLPCSLWESFVQFRKDMKSKMTDHAQNLAIKKLQEFRDQGHDIEEIINTSIMNGWKGLFPIRRNKNGGLNGSQQASKARNMEQGLNRAFESNDERSEKIYNQFTGEFE